MPVLSVSHPEPLSTLWGYGVSYILSRLRIEFKAEFFKDFCSIKISTPQNYNLNSHFRQELIEEIRSTANFISVTSKGVGNVFADSAKIKEDWGIAGMGRRGSNRNWQNGIWYSINQNNLTNFVNAYIQGHQCRGNNSPYIFFSPYSGTKRIFFLEGKEQTTYYKYICERCYISILLGFFNFSRYYFYRKKEGNRETNKLVIFLPSVEGRVDQCDIHLLLSFSSRNNLPSDFIFIGDKITSSKAFSIYILSQGETSFFLSSLSEATAKLMIWIVEGAKVGNRSKAPSIRRFEVVELERLLNAIAEIKLNAPEEWRILLNKVANNDEGDELLSLLYEAILYRNRDCVYTFVRRCHKLNIPVDEKIVRALLRI